MTLAEDAADGTPPVQRQAADAPESAGPPSRPRSQRSLFDGNLIIDGDGHGTGVGWSIRPGGDLNRDGFGDAILGAPGFFWYTDASSGGRADLFLGGAAASFAP